MLNIEVRMPLWLFIFVPVVSFVFGLVIQEVTMSYWSALHNQDKKEDGSCDCDKIYTCCDCGGNDCGCAYCWSCNACDDCKEED